MHIHGPSSNSYAANLYAAGNDPRTAAAQRAADTRKKLQKAADSPDSGVFPEETVMINQWLDARHSQTQSAGEYKVSLSGSNQDFD